MMSLEAIRHLADEAAQSAAAEDLEPYVPWDADEVDSFPPFPFPNLGSHRPDGWELVETLFVDSSGFGAENEPALTIPSFLREIKGRIDEEVGYGVIEEGPFQVVVGVFRQGEGGAA